MYQCLYYIRTKYERQVLLFLPNIKQNVFFVHFLFVLIHTSLQNLRDASTSFA